MMGLRLFLVAAAWRHAEAALLLESTNETSTSGTGVVQVVKAAENEALPSLLDALERAKKLGIDNMTVAGEASSISRAAADLSLLSEVTALASSCLTHVPSGLKAAVATAGIDTARIMESFNLAERAGVPAEEIEAARTALNSELSKRLSAATASLSGASANATGSARRLSSGSSSAGSSAGTLEELANVISLASSLNFRGEELKGARQSFEEALEVAAETTDMDFVERMTAIAELAGTRVPTDYPRWSATMRTLREAVELSENSTDSLADLERAVIMAQEAAMPPSVPEFVTVKAKAQSCSLLALRNTMATLDPNTTSVAPGVLDVLLADLKRCQSFGVPSTSLAQAVSKAQTFALAEIDADLATDLTDTSAVRDAFAKAVAVGVSAQDIASKTAVRDRKAQARLAAASTAIGMSPTAAKIRELAIAINVAVDLGVANGTAIAAARSLYEQQLQVSSNTSSTDLFEAVVEMAEWAGVKAPTSMINQLTALRHVQTASTQSDCEVGATESYLDFLAAFRRAVDAALPSYPVMLDVKAKVQNCAAINLNTTVGTSGLGLDIYLGALEEAREVGVQEMVLAAAASTVQATAKAALSQAVGASPPIADDVHMAFNDAERAGVSAADLASAAASLTNKTSLRLQAAQAALGSINATATASAIEELAKAINVGSRVAAVQNVLKTQLAAARALYEQKFDTPITASNMAFFEAATAFADTANAKVPTTILELLNTARRLREAADGTEDLSELMQLLDESELAQTPLSQDKLLITERAKAKAHAELEAAIAGAKYDTIKEALTAAVQAGVNQANLESAKTVISSM